MRATRAIVIVAIIAILTISNLPRLAVAQTSPWIDESLAKQYVDNMITSYNAVVQAHQASYPNFTTYKANFQLWHDVGYNFKVLVMRVINLTSTNLVGFTFEPIQANDPQVVIDNNDTVSSLFRTLPITTGGQTYEFGGGGTYLYTSYGTAYVYYYVNFPDRARTIPIIWVTGSECVLNYANGTSSKGAADSIYQADVAHSKPPNSTVTRTYPTNPPLAGCILESGGLTSLPNPNPAPNPLSELLDFINNNQAVKAIDAVFGSLLFFVLFIAIVVVVITRKRVKTEIREALHMEKSSRKKKGS